MQSRASGIVFVRGEVGAEELLGSLPGILGPRRRLGRIGGRAGLLVDLERDLAGRDLIQEIFIDTDPTDTEKIKRHG